MTFSAVTYQNEFLSKDSTEVHAIVTVDADGTPTAATADVQKAIVLMIDASSSMLQPATKIEAARTAAATAISLIPDGTLFAVIRGSHVATLAYPTNQYGLAYADDVTRAEAIAAVRLLKADGGTAMSTWLDLARGILEQLPGAIRLAYLLTDGRNESEQRRDLDAQLARCAGVFQCDARGVGANWMVDELRLISSALLGQVDIIKSAAEMDDDFRLFLERAIGKNVTDVRLRVWTPKGSTTRFVRQVSPTVEPLHPLPVPVNELTWDYPTGAWGGGESRDYHVCVDVPQGDVGDERLAARVSLVVDDVVVAQSLVKALWTDDDALSTRINAQVAHYTGQAELAQTIQEGLEARRLHDDQTATIKLGRAVQLANESGNEQTVKLLKRVVDVEDIETGTVRLRRDVGALDEMALDTRSTRTVRVRQAEPAGAADDGGEG
jgi:hypothetical protein